MNQTHTHTAGFLNRWTWVAVSLGSNQGNRQRFLDQAVGMILRSVPLGKMKLSSVYETKPIDCITDDVFLNAVACFQTKLTPWALLEALQRIENFLGRNRPYPNAPRTIDLDILLYGNRIVREVGLKIPHPRLHRRLFALAPLKEIGFPHPHPVLHQTIEDLLEHARQMSGADNVIELSHSRWAAELPR